MEQLRPDEAWTFAIRIFFFPILLITQFLKSIFSETFEKDYMYTPLASQTTIWILLLKHQHSSCTLNVYILVMTWRGPEHHMITRCAIVSSFISVSKTAAEGQAMWLLKEVPPISHWVPLFPYFVLTTITRCSFYFRNTMISFLIASTWISVTCILITLNTTPHCQQIIKLSKSVKIIKNYQN